MRRLVWASLAAVAGAGVILVTVVMPAEYGIDPLGTGEALGLVVLSDPAAGEIAVRSDGLLPQPAEYHVERRSFELPPEGSVEYKFRLDEGDAMIYAWSATDTVRSEMHSERDGAPEGTAEFFEVREATLSAAGTFVAPFPGDHGWYWLNRSRDTVSVTLHAVGFFDDAIEYPSSGDPILRDMTVTPEQAFQAEPGL